MKNLIQKPCEIDDGGDDGSTDGGDGGDDPVDAAAAGSNCFIDGTYTEEDPNPCPADAANLSCWETDGDEPLLSVTCPEGTWNPDTSSWDVDPTTPAEYPVGSCGHHAWGKDRVGLKCEDEGKTPYDEFD